jgi:hypothetical protein
LRASELKSGSEEVAILPSALVAMSFISYEEETKELAVYPCRKLRENSNEAATGLNQQPGGCNSEVCQTMWIADRQRIC